MLVSGGIKKEAVIPRGKDGHKEYTGCWKALQFGGVEERWRQGGAGVRVCRLSQGGPAVGWAGGSPREGVGIQGGKGVGREVSKGRGLGLGEAPGSSGHSSPSAHAGPLAGPVVWAG